MRIRRENSGKDVIVNAAIEIENVDHPEAYSDELILRDLMEKYAIPLLIEMGERMFKAIRHDLKRTKKNKKYAFTLVCQDITEGI